MDELELLKKDWQKDNIDYPKLTREDIFPMLLKKSSSIVKILLYISIAELILWVSISVAPMFLSEDINTKLNLDNVYNNFNLIITIIGITIVIAFVYLLYKSYRSISVTDNSKKLMENILKTRLVVKQYVGFNLVLIAISTVYEMSSLFKTNSDFTNEINGAAADGEIFKYYAVIILVVLVIILSLAVLFLVYWLMYGILLKRLNRNYKELKKLEIRSSID